MSARPGPLGTPDTSVPQSSIDRALLDESRFGGGCMHLGAVLLFDGDPPGLDALAAHLTERLPLAPELTFRAAGTARRPRWEPDPAFDVRNHLHLAAPAPGPGPLADRVINAMLGLPLDPGRPLWGLWAVPTGHGHALCYRAHHGYQDGQAAARTVRTLFAPSPSRPTRRPTTPPVPRLEPGVVRDVLPLLRRPARWSALDAPPGSRRLATTTDTDLTRLKAIARTTSTTVNQVCLALVTSLLRGCFPRDWPHPRQTVRTAMGLSLRSPRAPYPCLGNQSGADHIALPCGEPSAPRRLEILRERITPEHLAQVRRHQAALLGRLPRWSGKFVVRVSTHPRFVQLAVVDIRGRTSVAFGGRQAQAVYALPPWIPRQPLMITWITYRDRLHATFLASDEFAGRTLLADLWHQAVDDLGREARVRTL
ncbi:wax ester/triacylglycerol synthase family O-acyltransferase [Streptomyces sp. B1866]|uniref:wax ester/triacylglycerol synthase domain-containing protein n=1 Tax=Streptomyces sp. B1866 TaxID=3075431 RepID=UPI00288FD96F|nr:wax ester/triacylglycerol synthase domain-containing protein [Streptomyces sp. B1866]MDT3396013.1 wax ester/triacylglycerol synthase family O-acyltransferase [Streptomyces sp. B1866]